MQQISEGVKESGFTAHGHCICLFTSSFKGMFSSRNDLGFHSELSIF